MGLQVPAGNLIDVPLRVVVRFDPEQRAVAEVDDAHYAAGRSRLKIQQAIPQQEATPDPRPADILAVYPDRRNLSPKARVFIDFLAERLSKLVAS